ncbi:MAG: hypothetical protein ACRBF0_20615 [Calditrichia bacterium]
MAKKGNYGRSVKPKTKGAPGIIDAYEKSGLPKVSSAKDKPDDIVLPTTLKEAKANLKEIKTTLSGLNLSEANKMTVEMGLQQAEQHMNLEEISQQRIAKAIKQVLEALQGEEEFEAAKGKLVTPVKTVARWLGNNWLHILELLEEE